MPKETKLEEVLRCTLESLRKKGYSIETLMRYQGKFHVLISIAQKRGFQNQQRTYFRYTSVITKTSILESIRLLKSVNESGL